MGIIFGVLLISLLLAFVHVVRISIRRSGVEIEHFQNNKEKSHWSEDELTIVAYYVLFEKGETNDMGIINSLADGLNRSVKSILRKVYVMENFEKVNGGYKLANKKFNELKKLGKIGSENVLQNSIKKVVF